MSRILQALTHGLTHYPIRTNAVLYGSMFVGAEMTNQTLSKKILVKGEPQPYEWGNVKRCGIFGTFGQGPFMTVWYRWLDGKHVGTTRSIVVRKLIMDQLLFTPVLYVFFYICMNILEGKKDVFDELRRKFVKTFATSCCFWIPVQSFNFAAIPPIYRVAYMGCAAFVWVTILCYIKDLTY